MIKNKTDLIAEFKGITIIHQKIPGHEVGKHSHKDHEFFIPLQGEITLTFKDKTLKVGPGRMLYVPPSLDHTFSSTAQGSGERVIGLIDSKLWTHQVGEKFEPTSLPINNLVKEIIFYLLVRPKNAGAPHFISALIEALSDSLAGARITESNSYFQHIGGKIKDERIRTSIELIDENLNMKIPDVARRSGLSQRNFSRLFLQEIGMTPKDFLILKRIDRAKLLLKSSRLSITDISFEVGYNSLSKFIETFRKIEGTLPSDFRNSHKTN